MVTASRLSHPLKAEHHPGGLSSKPCQACLRHVIATAEYIQELNMHQGLYNAVVRSLDHYDRLQSHSGATSSSHSKANTSQVASDGLVMLHLLSTMPAAAAQVHARPGMVPCAVTKCVQYVHMTCTVTCKTRAFQLLSASHRPCQLPRNPVRLRFMRCTHIAGTDTQLAQTHSTHCSRPMHSRLGHC